MKKAEFKVKKEGPNLGKLKYFLGIEVLENENGLCLSQRKYCLELLQEYGLFVAKTVDAPLPENTTHNHIGSNDDKILSFPVIGVQISENGILKLIAYADSNWAICHVNRKSVSEAEYRIMASATCEVIWLSNLLSDMGIKGLFPVVLQKVSSSVIKTEKIHNSQQIANVLTKALDSNKKCLVDAEVFWKILDICPRVQGVDMLNVPDDEIDNKQLKKGRCENMPYPRIGEDFQEYGLPIPETMLTEGIKQSKSYQMFIKYSTGQIPPKKSRGKGSQEKKTADIPEADADVLEELTLNMLETTSIEKSD
ncbi:hypothetical protein Tco_0877819 [Tanacetum coccineum]|uniref:Reverse transcriptase Ty1/copia-type domain-containing protein n=1 Tax=Tanacetum coccineum TaxID=301880 RepID=A0ABQ5BZL0_9ASTR